MLPLCLVRGSDAATGITPDITDLRTPSKRHRVASPPESDFEIEYNLEEDVEENVEKDVEEPGENSDQGWRFDQKDGAQTDDC